MLRNVFWPIMGLMALFLIVGCSSESGGGADSVLPDSADQAPQADAVEEGDVEADVGPVDEDAGPLHPDGETTLLLLTRLLDKAQVLYVQPGCIAV